MHKLLWSILGVISFLSVQAQEVKLQANLDTNLIVIGEQFNLTLQATYGVQNGTPNIAFPTYKDTIIKGIEVLEIGARDTFLVDPTNDPYTFTLRQKFLLTSFDSGLYVIPGITFQVNDQEATTNPLVVQVATIQIDTTKGIVDIMEPVDLPISFGEYVQMYQSYIWWSLAIIILILVFIWLYRKYKARPVVEKEEIIPDLAPHIWAFEKLEKLKAQNYFEQGLAKKYYSELTFILRAYFEKRYQFLALEITSDEILKEIRLFGLKTEQLDGLRRLLTLADLVKFAKEEPMKQDIDWSLSFVEKLISDIKIEEETPQDESHENNA